MAVGGGTTGIDAEKFAKDLARSTAKAAKEALKGLAATQAQLIDVGQKPDGSSQQKNKPSTIRRKKHNKPMFDKGVLHDVTQWRVRRRKNEMVLRPPASRETAVAVNRSRNYRTVFDELPDAFDDALQAKLDEHTAKVEARAKRRAKKRAKGK
ncbi:MAG: hypothetical protein ACYTBJ_16265 [Planctomycetota bacterium]|jgi:hypothetical protein